MYKPMRFASLGDLIKDFLDSYNRSACFLLILEKLQKLIDFRRERRTSSSQAKAWRTHDQGRLIKRGDRLEGLFSILLASGLIIIAKVLIIR